MAPVANSHFKPSRPCHFVMLLTALSFLLGAQCRVGDAAPYDPPLVTPDGEPQMYQVHGFNFVADVTIDRRVYVSNPLWKDMCRFRCLRDPFCYGNYEQTHLCPEPDNADGVSDPNITPGVGCFHECGFIYDLSPSDPGARLENNSLVSGSVWEKVFL